MWFPQPWMSSYEEILAGDPQCTSLDLERTAFFHRGAFAGFPGDFSGSPQTRLAAAHILPAHRVSLRRAGGGPPLFRLRCSADEFLRDQPRQSFRSVHVVLRDPAVCARLGAGV